MLSFVEQDRKRLRPHKCHSWLMSQKVGKKNSQPFSSHLERKLLALLLGRTEIKEGISMNNTSSETQDDIVFVVKVYCKIETILQ